jgi:hypothetical protein
LRVRKFEKMEHLSKNNVGSHSIYETRFEANKIQTMIKILEKCNFLSGISDLKPDLESSLNSTVRTATK